jgi:hypothetical protein
VCGVVERGTRQVDEVPQQRVAAMVPAQRDHDRGVRGIGTGCEDPSMWRCGCNPTEPVVGSRSTSSTSSIILMISSHLWLGVIVTHLWLVRPPSLLLGRAAS